MTTYLYECPITDPRRVQNTGTISRWRSKTICSKLYLCGK